MAGPDSNAPVPTEIKLHQASRVMELSFADGAVSASVRIPASLFALGRSARPRPRPGNAAGRQARRHHYRGRGGRPLCDPAHVLGRPRDRHLLLGLSLRSRHPGTMRCGTDISSGSTLRARAAMPIRTQPPRRPPTPAAISTEYFERKDALRFRASLARGKGAASPRRVRVGCDEVRPDERPHVRGPAPRLEEVRRRGKRRAQEARACWTSRAGPAISRGCSRIARARLAGSCSPTSMAQCWRSAATGCSTKASCCLPSNATPRRCRSRRAPSTA